MSDWQGYQITCNTHFLLNFLVTYPAAVFVVVQNGFLFSATLAFTMQNIGKTYDFLLPCLIIIKVAEEEVM